MKVKHRKELRMSEFSGIDGGFLTDLKRKGTCHKIPHKWEGRPSAFQSDYLGSLPTIFFERMIIGHDGERGSSQGKGVVLESKTQ